MKVLIIDDDQMIINMWSVALKHEGYEIVTATNGRQGIDEAKRNIPNFILLDQIMPDMKGNDVLKQLKQDMETKDIPVALVSNYSEAELMQDAIQAGAVDYILKYQIEPKDLVTKIRSLSGTQNAQTPPQTS